MTSCSSTWTGNGVYLLAASSLQALSKAHRNSSSAAFEECLFPNQRVLLLGSSAQGLGLRGTRRCECPQRERMLTWGKLWSGGDGGEEEPCSPKLCLFRADVEKEGELELPQYGQDTCVRAGGQPLSPSQQCCHHSSAPALRVNRAACTQRAALPSMGIADTLETCGSLGKMLFF